MRIAGTSTTGNSGYKAVLLANGVLDIVIRGVWTADEVDAFFQALVPLHDTARRRFGRVYALVVVEAVQSPIVALRVRNHAVALRQPEDKRAFVWFTALAKLQITRLRVSETLGLFTDRAAAEAWLLA